MGAQEIDGALAILVRRSQSHGGGSLDRPV
jgi:hypothetical protein